MTKCLVRGCANDDADGRFREALCGPCYRMLWDGEIGHGTTFIHDLKNQLKTLRLRVKLHLDMPSSQTKIGILELLEERDPNWEKFKARVAKSATVLGSWVVYIPAAGKYADTVTRGLCYAEVDAFRLRDAINQMENRTVDAPKECYLPGDDNG